MNFKKKISVILIVISFITCASVPTTFASDNLNSKNISMPSKLPVLNDNPEPIFKANKNKSISSFVSKNTILANFDKEKADNKNLKIESAELKTWGEYVANDRKEPDFRCGDISDDHMVWVVKIDYPSGASFPDAGDYVTAKVTCVCDAETQQTLAVDITGKPKGRRLGGNPRMHKK